MRLADDEARGLPVPNKRIEPSLDGVGAVILDEVHERGLDTDLLVGLLGEVRELRDDLAVVAMSATADAAGLARLLGGKSAAPVVGVPAVPHPLEARFAPGPQPTDARGVSRDFLRHVVDTTVLAVEDRPGDGDVLAFLPGAREVRVVAVSKTVGAAFTLPIARATMSVGRSWGMIAMPPRRATVSAIRRPATAVMLATIIGSGRFRPSVLVMSTSRRDVTEERRGAMKTSS